MEGRIKLDGPDNPKTFTCMLNLAVSLEGQNKNFEEIEELYLKVVKGRKIILGDNHPRYLHSLKLLCLFLDNNERYQEAVPYIIRII